MRILPVVMSNTHMQNVSQNKNLAFGDRSLSPTASEITRGVVQSSFDKTVDLALKFQAVVAKQEGPKAMDTADTVIKALTGGIIDNKTV